MKKSIRIPNTFQRWRFKKNMADLEKQYKILPTYCLKIALFQNYITIMRGLSQQTTEQK